MPFIIRDAKRLYWRSDGDPARPALLLGNSLGTEILLLSAIYCGVPAANTGFHKAAETLADVLKSTG